MGGALCMQVGQAAGQKQEPPETLTNRGVATAATATCWGGGAATAGGDDSRNLRRPAGQLRDKMASTLVAQLCVAESKLRVAEAQAKETTAAREAAKRVSPSICITMW
jgi:hypothetical protein